ncbi:hypothetical protein NC651_034096 [Populus alba x Populus x berolinensis]|nr:hypothetical protein NC651_034096 [Populus alba x Populus x berolinensis]
MNQKMKINNKKNKKNEMEFCEVCNLNNDEGQNHKYYPNHKKSLSNFLSRFQTKIVDVDSFSKALTFSALESPLATASGASSAISISTRPAAPSHGAAMGSDGSRGMQISNSGFSAVANVGPSMYCVVSTLPVHAHSGTCLCNPNDLTANWNSQRSFPYNSINRAPNLGNGQLRQVYQGERSVLGVSTLWGSHNIPQVPAMALQLDGVTLVPALTPQMAGGNVHTGVPPWFEAIEENQLNIQHDSQKESRKEFENEKQKLPNVESHTEMPVRIQPYISKQMVISKLQVLVYSAVLIMSHLFHFQAWLVLRRGGVHLNDGCCGDHDMTRANNASGDKHHGRNSCGTSSHEQTTNFLQRWFHLAKTVVVFDSWGSYLELESTLK